MDRINISVTPEQAGILLNLLKPYAELSISLSSQLRSQSTAAVQKPPVRAQKINPLEEKVNGNDKI